MGYCLMVITTRLQQFSKTISAKSPSRKVIVRKVGCESREGERESWLPGCSIPAHLDGSLPGDFGFDPLGLGKDPAALKWYQQAELQHARWAMLGVTGILIQGIVKPEISFMDAGKKVAESSYASFGTLLVIQIILMGFAEGRRWQDIRKPGGTTDVGYPGGIFDPAGFSKVSASRIEELKLKEIKNGRLAMLAYVGFSCAYVCTGKGPLEALSYHLSDPWSHSVVNSTYAIPFLQQ